MITRTVGASVGGLLTSALLALGVASTASASDGAAALSSHGSSASATVAMTGAYDRAVQALIAGDDLVAELAYREAIDHADRGEIRDARYALSCVELAMLRARVGDTEEAVSLMAKAHSTRRRLLGVEHPDVIETRLMLRQLQRERLGRADAGLLRLTALTDP